MRRCLVLVAAVAALAAPAATAAGSPSVAFVKLSPATVSGTGFAPNALVRVKVTWRQGLLSRLVRTTQAGTFTVRWPASVVLFRCRGLAVTATPTIGTRVLAKAGTKSCAAIAVPAA